VHHIMRRLSSELQPALFGFPSMHDVYDLPLAEARCVCHYFFLPHTKASFLTSDFVLISNLTRRNRVYQKSGIWRIHEPTAPGHRKRGFLSRADFNTHWAREEQMGCQCSFCLSGIRVFSGAYHIFLSLYGFNRISIASFLHHLFYSHFERTYLVAEIRKGMNWNGLDAGNGNGMKWMDEWVAWACMALKVLGIRARMREEKIGREG